MIKNVKTKGFKGESMDINLTGLDLIVGENGSGKTKILQSIEFALQSKVGAVKSNAELIAEFSHTEMSATLTGDDFEVHRDLSGYMRKGEFKIDHNLSVKAGGQYETSLKKADELITNELYVSPIVFNFSDFIDQSAADRRKYIMDLVGETSLTVEQIQNYVLSNAMDLEPEETVLLNKEVKELTGSIETMVKIADTKFKKWNAEQKETSAATRKIADIKSDLTANVALKGSLSEIKADLEVQVQNMRDDFLRMQQHNAQVLSIDGTIGMLALKIRDLKMRDFASEINEHKTQYEAEKGKVVDPYREDVVTAAFEEYEALDTDVKSIQNNITGLKQAKSAQEFKLAEAKMLRRNLEDKFNGLVANTCNMTGLPCTADLSEYKNGITTELNEVESLIDTILEIIRVNESDISESTNALSLKESQKDASCARWLAFKQGNESAEKQNNIIQSRLDHINGLIRVLEAEQAGVGAQIANYQSQIDVQPVLTAYTDVEFDKIKMMGVTTKNDLEATNSKLDEIIKKNQMLAAEQQSLEASEIALYHFNVWKEIKRLIGPKGIQGDIIRNNLGPLNTRITELLVSFGMIAANEAEFYFSLEDARGNQKFDFGIKSSEVAKGFSALSKSEQIITALAMTIAMQSYAPDKLRMLIIDEINNLYGERLNYLLRGLCDLTGQYNNIIVAGALYLDKVDVGRFNVIQL